MAEMYFKINADFEELKKAQQEVERLKKEMSDFSGAKEEFDDLNDRLNDAQRRVTELAKNGFRNASQAMSDFASKVSSSMGVEEIEKVTRGLEGVRSATEAVGTQFLESFDKQNLSTLNQVIENSWFNMSTLNEKLAQAREAMKSVADPSVRAAFQAYIEELEQAISYTEKLIIETDSARMSIQRSMSEEKHQPEPKPTQGDLSREILEENTALETNYSLLKQKYDALVQLQAIESERLNKAQEANDAGAIESSKQKLEEYSKAADDLLRTMSAMSQSILTVAEKSTFIDRLTKVFNTQSVKIDEVERQLRRAERSLELYVEQYRELQQNKGNMSNKEFKQQEAELKQNIAQTSQAAEVLRSKYEMATEKAEGIKTAMQQVKESQTITAQDAEALVAQFEQGETKVMRMRTEMMQAREALARMLAEGKGNTLEFIQTAEKAGELRKQFTLSSATMNYWANPQKALTSTKAAIQGMTGVMQVGTGVMGLFNSKSEKMQMIQTKIQALMSITMGVERAYQLLQKKGAVYQGVKYLQLKLTKKALIENATATAVGTGAEKTRNATTWAGVAAQKALNVAMKANPIGIVLTALGALVSMLAIFSKSKKEYTKMVDESTKYGESLTFQTNNIERLQSLINVLDSKSRLYKDVVGELNSQLKTYNIELVREGDTKEEVAAKTEALARALEHEQKARNLANKGQEAQDQFKQDVDAAKKGVREALGKAEYSQSFWDAITGDVFDIGGIDYTKVRGNRWTIAGLFEQWLDEQDEALKDVAKNSNLDERKEEIQNMVDKFYWDVLRPKNLIDYNEDKGVYYEITEDSKGNADIFVTAIESVVDAYAELGIATDNLKKKEEELNEEREKNVDKIYDAEHASNIIEKLYKAYNNRMEGGAITFGEDNKIEYEYVVTVSGKEDVEDVKAALNGLNTLDFNGLMMTQRAVQREIELVTRKVDALKRGLHEVDGTPIDIDISEATNKLNFLNSLIATIKTKLNEKVVEGSEEYWQQQAADARARAAKAGANSQERKDALEDEAAAQAQYEKMQNEHYKNRQKNAARANRAAEEAARKAEREAERKYKNEEKYLSKKVKREEEILKGQIDMEKKLSDARIKSMQDGAKKTLAQMDANYKNEMRKLELQSRELMKKRIEDEKERFDQQQEDLPAGQKKHYYESEEYKKHFDDKGNLKIDKDILDEQKTFEILALNTYNKEMSDLYQKSLDDLKDYFDEWVKLEIDYSKKQQKLKDDLESGLITQDAYDVAMESLKRKRADEMREQEFKDFKGSADFRIAMGGEADIETLERLRNELKNFMDTAKDMPVDEYKTYYDTYMELTEKIVANNPFKVLLTAKEEYDDAVKSRKEAEDNLNSVYSKYGLDSKGKGGELEKTEKAIEKDEQAQIDAKNELNKATLEQFNIEQRIKELNDKQVEMPDGTRQQLTPEEQEEMRKLAEQRAASEGKVANAQQRVDNITKRLGNDQAKHKKIVDEVKDAENNLGKATENEIGVKKKLKTALKETSAQVKEFSAQLGAVVGNISKPLGEAITAFGDLTSAAVSGMEEMVKEGANALTKSIAILAIIQAAWQVINAIMSLFGNKEQENYERELDSLNAKVNALDYAYKVLKNDMDDAFGLDGIRAYSNALDVLKDKTKAQRQLAKTQLTYHGSHHSLLHDLEEAGISSERIEALLRMSPEQLQNYLATRAGIDLMSRIGGVKTKSEYKGSDFVSDLQAVADAFDEEASLMEDAAARLNGISFDDLTEQFKELAMNANLSMQEINNSFDSRAREAIYNKIRSSYDSEMEKWYDELNKLEEEKTKGLSEIQYRSRLEALREKYANYIYEANEQYKNDLEAAGVNMEDLDAEASSKGFQTMSQDTADELNGRFAALQIQGTIIASNTEALVKRNGELFDVADELRTIQANSLLELQEISENTRNLRYIRDDIERIKQKTENL